MERLFVGASAAQVTTTKPRFPIGRSMLRGAPMPVDENGQVRPCERLGGF
jgi:hypothetical protein